MCVCGRGGGAAVGGGVKGVGQRPEMSITGPRSNSHVITIRQKSAIGVSALLKTIYVLK